MLVAASFTQRPPFMYIFTLCVPCVFLSDPAQLWWSHLFYFWIHWAGQQQTSIHHRSCMDRSQGSQNASRCFVYTGDHLSLTHGVYPLWFLSLHPAQLWWGLQFLNIYIGQAAKHLFHNRSCMDRSQGSQSASRCFVYTATTFHLHAHGVYPCVILLDPSIVMELSISQYIYIYDRQRTPISQSQLHGSIPELSECYSRCCVYTATTFHVYTHCVYPVCSF